MEAANPSIVSSTPSIDKHLSTTTTTKMIKFAQWKNVVLPNLKKNYVQNSPVRNTFLFRKIFYIDRSAYWNW